MSEHAPPPVPASPVDGPQEPLSAAAVEALLGDFRAWLQQTPPAPAVADDPADAVDVHTLLGQLVALKQEVNLQTKSTRAQSQQNAEALQQLAKAVDLLQTQSEALADVAETALEERTRPVLKTLVDLHDALALAQRETQRLHDGLRDLPEPVAVADTPPPPLVVPEPPPPPHAPPAAAPPPKPSFWAGMFGAPPPAPASVAPAAPDAGVLAAYRAALKQAEQGLAEQHARLLALREQQAAARANEERLRHMLASVRTGYAMSLQRLERALHQHGLEPMDCVGESFDPERMEVVEVVTEPGRHGTEVLEEVRRGYLRGGRVFRFAQVRVARG